jgi:hypothetical protein
MTSLERWQSSQIKDFVFHVRVSADQEKILRELSYRYNLSVSQVIRDLMADGLAVLQKRIQK